MSQRRRVKFREWRIYQIYANFFHLSLERNATERRNRIRVYSCDRLRCGERQRMRREAFATYCEPGFTRMSIIKWGCYFSQGCATVVYASATLSLSITLYSW